MKPPGVGDGGEGYIRVSYAASMDKLKAFMGALKSLKNKQK